MKKKILIILIMVLCLLCTGAYASENKLSIIGTQKDGVYYIGVHIETEVPLCVGSFEIEYDSSRFLLSNLTKSEALGDAITEINEKYQNNSAKVSFMSIEPIMPDGEIVSFQVSPKLADVSGEIKLKNVLFADSEEKIAEFEAVDFKIGNKTTSVSTKRSASGVSRPIVQEVEDAVRNNENDILHSDVTKDAETETNSISFTDLGSVPWAEEQILHLAKNGIINGTGNGEFSPESNIKRGDFVCMLIRMMEKTGGEAEEFSDVKKGEYWYDAIMTARSLGIAAGYENKFQPQQSITRQDMFVLVCRAYGFENETESAQYKDFDLVWDYAESSITALSQKGIIQGNDGYINPLGNATRAETAVMLYNISTNLIKEENSK